MFLSIIIPVYNMSKFLPDCLDSLLVQNIQVSDYEVICVNDGSTDNSDQIIQLYCSSHTTIRHISKPNGGVSSARNLGLEVAVGDWIWFVDADDFVQENILSELKGLATPEVDRILFPRYCFTDTLTASERSQKESGQIASNNPGRGIWCSLYRRSVITEHKIQFDVDIDYGEDIVWVCQFREYMHGTVSFEKVCYFYRMHSESAMQQNTLLSRRKRLKSYIKAGTTLYDIYKSQLIKKTDTADDVMFFLRMTMLEIAKLPIKEDRKRYIKEVRDKGLFPFAPLKEAKLKKAYVTNRTDFIGRTYNSLVMNSTKHFDFQMLSLWYRLYYMYKSLRTETESLL
mgnify:CR=1 FL=1